MARIISLPRSLLLVLALSVPRLFAADYDLAEAKKQFRAGEYSKAIQQGEAAVKDRQRGEDWQTLYARALWITGQYPEAKEAILAAHRYNYYSVRIRLLAYHILRANGDLREADEMLDEINNLGSSRRWGYSDPLDIVALGEAAVLLGADPKIVLDNFFSPVKKSSPETREVYLAIGKLALQKHDFALAGRAFQEGLQKFPDDPELLCGMAEALEPGDRKEMIAVLEKLFEANENHPQGRLLLAEHLIDAEEYDAAGTELDRVEKVNPHRPEMWAFRAVIAHLQNDSEQEEKSRASALAYWKTNPLVDHLIGRKLSQKYRFAEGAVCQRRALAFSPAYLPAKSQLAQDLLRLGQESEGWQLANQVFAADAYDVSAYNLVTLHDTMRHFLEVTNANFIVRMAPEEARVYGHQALELLDQARERLTKKYGVELEVPTTVEIFPQQKDFAIRTFGMPGGEGYLGVCFGNVITANSPASQNMNWHSMLWHEFCHVVTLNLTRNKMPRWLSEGISVYEERRASPRWGEQLNPQYREMILKGDMKPISDLSAAFMAPPTGQDLQFAYYQSSLVVEFLVEKFGIESIQGVLKDLGAGTPINEALVAHSAPMDQLEKDFTAFAQGLAKSMGADSVWEKPKQPNDPVWEGAHPENFWVLKKKAGELLQSDKPSDAIPILEQLVKLYPGQSGPDSAYARLAEIYRREKEPAKEQEILNQWVRLDGEAGDALARLIELDQESKDADAVLRHSKMLLQIDPLLPQPYQALAREEEERGQTADAINSYRTLLALNPPNRAQAHFQLARLLHQESDPEARRQVLLAIEEAPRFRKAHELLLQIADPGEPASPKTPPEPEPKP